MGVCTTPKQYIASSYKYIKSLRNTPANFSKEIVSLKKKSIDKHIQMDNSSNSDGEGIRRSNGNLNMLENSIAFFLGCYVERQRIEKLVLHSCVHNEMMRRPSRTPFSAKRMVGHCKCTVHAKMLTWCDAACCTATIPTPFFQKKVVHSKTFSSNIGETKF